MIGGSAAAAGPRHVVVVTCPEIRRGIVFPLGVTELGPFNHLEF